MIRNLISKITPYTHMWYLDFLNRLEDMKLKNSVLVVNIFLLIVPKEEKITDL